MIIKSIKVLLCVALSMGFTITSLGNVKNKTFWEDRERGYYFYEDPEVKEKEKEKEKTEEVKTPVKKTLTAREILKKDGEEMEEIFAQMQLDPSPENVHAYIKKSREITGRAYRAARSYGDEMFFVPGLNTRPNGLYPATVQINGREIENGITDKIRANNKEYALVFFMRSDCPYCKQFAPILKLVSEETDFHVITVSLDGGGLKEFPIVKNSQALAKRANVEQVPAVYLLNPKRDIMQAVSFGFRGYSDFRERFARSFDYIDMHKGKL